MTTGRINQIAIPTARPQLALPGPVATSPPAGPQKRSAHRRRGAFLAEYAAAAGMTPSRQTDSRGRDSPGCPSERPHRTAVVQGTTFISLRQDEPKGPPDPSASDSGHGGSTEHHRSFARPTTLDIRGFRSAAFVACSTAWLWRG